ncbi:MAG: MFS transporter [Verrucomicrobia bacterium]|nr:MFS transporter [Verrucomicrobiota bacterium]NBS04974.1 MFS transporter [Verrucomicrobiota bacterium]NBY36973.1 MFS transporter [Verrucomicrobiota bacterium]
MSLEPSGPSSAVASRSFRLYLASIVLGTIAIQIQGVAVAWKVFKLTEQHGAETAALALGAIGLAEVIPFVSSVLFAGHVADNNNRRRIAIGALLTMFILGLFLFLPEFLAARWAKLTVIYGVIILGGLARSFLTTARQAIIAELLPRHLLAGGVRWRNTLFELACVIGPGLAGLLIWAGGENGELFAYAAMALCFAGSLGLTIALRTTQSLQSRKAEPIFVSLRHGIDFMLSQRVMLGAFTLDLFAVLLGGAVALLPIFAGMLGVGALGFGLLRASSSAGAVLMSIYLIVRPPLDRAGPTLYASFAVFGLSTIGFALAIPLAQAIGLGLTAAFVLSFVFLLIGGAADAVNVIIRQTILQTSVPPEMMGRVSAVTAVFIGCSNELGMAESGLAAKLMGTVNSVVFGGVATFGVIALTAWKFPEIARLRRIGHESKP